jgi:hypothetical protein
MKARPGLAVTFCMVALMPPLTGTRAEAQRAAVLKAELAAAELSSDSGLGTAILRNIHRDGILLWPGAPVVAGADLKRLVGTPQLESLHLTWQPLGIEVARDSTLAATWGVAAASVSRSAIAPEIGNYIAAWRREGNHWTVAAMVFAGFRRLTPPGLTDQVAGRRRAIDAGGTAGHFIAADIAFARLAADSGAAVAFERWAAPDAVTFGDQGLLTHGPKAIGKAVDFPAAWSWHPVAAGAAGTGDLGWTVGEATIAGKDAAPTYSKYLTIWTRLRSGAIRFLTDGGNGRPATPPPAETPGE